MSADADIQHKALTAPQGCAFDGADHALVQIVLPEDTEDSLPEDSSSSESECSADESRIRKEILDRLFSWLLKFGNSETIGRAVLIRARGINHPDAPRTLDELGARFCTIARVGVGKSRASQVVSALNSEPVNSVRFSN